MKKQLSTLLACLVLAGCAQITPYRTSEPGAPGGLCRTTGSPLQCAQDTYFAVAAPEPKNDIPIGIIEFDDQGVLQNRRSKDKIVDRIRKLTDDYGAFVVVFAHGWLNNAAPDNGNLAEFQELLKRIAADDMKICEGRTCANRKLVGVYLAWRGMSATLEPFKSLSFWNRKTRAERVGQDGATEVLADLAQMLRGGKESVGSNRSKSRLIVIGHSFGGALVYSATQQLLMKDAASELGGGSVDRTVADMVILINPAFEAARLTSLHDRAAGMAFPPTQRPILAIFTSKTDYATKLAFPLGQRISSLFTKYNPRRKDQSSLDRTAVGHFADYQTHELKLVDKDAVPVSRAKTRCGWEDFGRVQETGKHSWDLGPVVLKRKDPTIEDSKSMNPYYNVVVDDAIISGHSGIWKPRYFMEFVTRFVMVQDEKSCAMLSEDNPTSR